MHDSRPGLILTASSIILGISGIALLFAPEQTSAFVIGEAATEAAGQLISAGFLAMAVVNWTGRGAVYGGIYGRPIVLGNFMFGFILGTTTLRTALEAGGWVRVFAVYGALHAACFAWMLMKRSPTAGGSGSDA